MASVSPQKSPGRDFNEIIQRIIQWINKMKFYEPFSAGRFRLNWIHGTTNTNLFWAEDKVAAHYNLSKSFRYLLRSPWWRMHEIDCWILNDLASDGLPHPRLGRETNTILIACNASVPELKFPEEFIANTGLFNFNKFYSSMIHSLGIDSLFAFA